jgi:hypothetical protein
MEVLTTFIRDHSREPWPAPGTVQPGTDPPRDTTRPDIQAAITVIGRRDPQRDRQYINLYAAYLIRADLTGADLTGADLTGADLTGAKLGEADLAGADTFGAVFTGADLSRAIWPWKELAPEGWVQDPGDGRLSRAHTDGDDSGH